MVGEHERIQRRRGLDVGLSALDVVVLAEPIL